MNPEDIILEKNNLFEDKCYSDKKIVVHHEDRFFKNYKLNRSDYNPVDSKIPRDESGFINMNEAAFITSNLIPDGHNFNTSFWTLHENGSRILFKEINGEENYEMELLFKELCDFLDISCASYDLATLNDIKYLITPSFLSLDDYLFDYYKLKFQKGYFCYDKNYLVDANNLLEMARKISTSENNHELHIKKMLLVDSLTNNYDRFPSNLRIKGRSKEIAPLFDNGGCCNMINKSLFTIPSFNFKCDNDKIIKYLFKDKDFFDLMSNKIKNISVEQLAEKIKAEKKIIISDQGFKTFKDTLDENICKIK